MLTHTCTRQSSLGHSPGVPDRQEPGLQAKPHCLQLAAPTLPNHMNSVHNPTPAKTVHPAPPLLGFLAATSTPEQGPSLGPCECGFYTSSVCPS